VFTRRTFLTGGLAVGASTVLCGPGGRARAQAPKPLLIGLTCDGTGAFAASGQAERRGIILAIEEQNARGGLLGRPIEHAWEDTESNPDVAARKAQRLIERERIDFMIGALSSAVAARLSELAQRYGIVYFNSNCGADSLTNERCQRTSFAWDASDETFARALAPLVARSLGKRWLILTQADAWGRSVTATTRESMKSVGASEAADLSIPPGTRDFSAQLLRIRATRPQVVMANLAGGEQAALREQARDFGADRDAHWVFPPLDYPDLYALGAGRAFGYFATTWHHAVTDPGAQDFVQRFRRRWTGAPIEVPCNVSCNGYIAARELFRAIERAGTTKNHDVIKALEGHVITDNFRKYPSRIREWDHLVEQMVYLAKARRADQMKDRYDLVEPVADIEPAAIAPPRDASRCKMPSFGETAVYGG
jgi:branched-chain amino acid transport system substrate-binding protein